VGGAHALQRKRANELGDDLPIENEPAEASASYDQ